MTLRVRRAVPTDAPRLGEVCYRAFKSIADAHNFTPDFPSAQHAAGMMARLIAHPGFFGVVGELDGTAVGSNFLDERGSISAVGPLTIDPHDQNSGAGRALMQAVIARSQERGRAGIRLVQAGYHNRSLSLYLKLGFSVQEQLACVQGAPIQKDVPGHTVRVATLADLSVCNELCLRVHGHTRSGELTDGITDGGARVVEFDGRITGYSSAVAFFGYSVGESNDALQALLGAAEAFGGAGVLIPTRNSDLLRWCLSHDLRITQTLTLMSIGLYGTPNGAWIPSILY